MCRGHWSRGSSSKQAGSSEEGSGGEKSVARVCLWWAGGGGHLRSSAVQKCRYADGLFRTAIKRFCRSIQCHLC